MSASKIVLDRQATAQNFSIGTTSASGEGLLTINKGTQADTQVVLDVKGSANIVGNLNLTGSLNVTGTINQQNVTNLNVSDLTIKSNVGGTTPVDDTAGLLIEGTSAAIVGALLYNGASQTKWSIGDGTSQQDIVGTTATQTLTNKTLTSPSISSPSGLVKADVGLGSVDNTSDASKPVSTATQTALNLKANLASPTFTGTVVLPASQIVNGVTLSTAQGTGNFLRGDGTYAAPPVSTVYHRSTVVSGTQDSTNKVFTIANTLLSGSEQVFINGQLLMPGGSNDYVYNGTTTITFQAGFTAPSATDVIRVYGAF
jgi:hypothetical protein